MHCDLHILNQKKWCLEFGFNASFFNFKVALLRTVLNMDAIPQELWKKLKIWNTI